MPLKVRMIGLDDYTIHEDRQLIGRIRYTSEPSPGVWLWTCVVTLPGPPSGEAHSLDEAKGRFKISWEKFKVKYTAEELAKALAAVATTPAYFWSTWVQVTSPENVRFFTGVQRVTKPS